MDRWVQMANQRKGSVLAVMMLAGVVLAWGQEDVGAMAKECSPIFQKVMGCMEFATGKAEAPRKECCEAVTEIRESSPKCMCFVIQETKNGSEQVRSLGIRADKLLQLPTVCHLKNTSVTDCPKLLGLATNSPEALIFTSNSTATPSAPGTAAKATPTEATKAANEISGADPLRPRSPAATGVVVLFLGIFQVALGLIIS